MGLTPPRTSQKHSECVNPENHILSKNKFGIFQDLRIYYAAILYNSFLTYTLRALFIVSCTEHARQTNMGVFTTPSHTQKNAFDPVSSLIPPINTLFIPYVQHYKYP